MKTSSLTSVGLITALTLTAGWLTSARAQDPAAPAAAGKINGRILFDGERPEVKPLIISAEQSKECCSEGASVDTTDRSLLLDAEGGVANVVVTVEIEGRAPKASEKPLLIDQKHCRFEPHILVLPVGGKIECKNSDTVSHNVHTYGFKNENMNKTVGAGGSEVLTLDKAEPFKFACDIHPWMSGYVFVTDASAWALTGADGRFELPPLPPGEYELELWHEKLGKGKGTATIGADGSCSAVEIKMALKKKKGSRRPR